MSKAKKKMELEYVQQGDLLFYRVGDAGVETEHEEDTSKIVLEGEASGHMHRLTSPTSRLFKFPVQEDGSFGIVDVPESDIVVHDDHLPVTLRAGTYIVKQVQEIDVVGVMADLRQQEVARMQAEEAERQRREAERRRRQAVYD